MKQQNNYSIRSKNKIKYLFMVNSIVYINSYNINNKEYCIFDNDNILNINTENNQNYVKDELNINTENNQNYVKNELNINTENNQNYVKNILNINTENNQNYVKDELNINTENNQNYVKDELNINTKNNQNYVKDKFNIENNQYNIFHNEFENNIFIYNNINVEDESNNKIEIIHNKNPYNIEEKINNKNIYDINRNTILNIENNSGYNENKHEINENIQIKNIYNINGEDKIKKKELKKVISLKRKRRTKAEIEESKKDENKNINENKKIKKKPGRKQKKTLIEDHNIQHTNISNDNIVKKINHLVISNFRNFINKKILDSNDVNENDYKDTKTALNKIIKNKNIRILYKINPKILINSNVEHNQKFINKTMKEILSSDISKKYKKEKNKNYNKNLIDDLINKDSTKYEEIFNLKFIDVLNYYIGKSENGKLSKMKKYNKEDEKQDEKYKERIVKIMENYKDFSTIVRYRRNEKKINISK